MNVSLNELLNNIKQLNSYDASALLWSLNYAVSSAAINAIVRALPDVPDEGAGIDVFNAYSQALHTVDTSAAHGYIALKKELDAIAEVYTDSDLPVISDTASFMASRIPTRQVYVNAYNARKIAGTAPRVSMRDYVNSEFTTALRTHTILSSKIDDAVRTIAEIEDTCIDVVVSEEFVDGLYTRLIPKLEARWVKAELHATNPRSSEAYRNEASANLLLIEELLIFVGGTIPATEKDSDTSVDDAHFEREAFALDKLAA